MIEIIDINSLEYLIEQKQNQTFRKDGIQKIEYPCEICGYKSLSNMICK